jgi:hypothetical protein
MLSGMASGARSTACTGAGRHTTTSPAFSFCEGADASCPFTVTQPSPICRASWVRDTSGSAWASAASSRRPAASGPITSVRGSVGAAGGSVTRSST